MPINSKQAALNALSEVKESQQYFYMCNGVVIKNLDELYLALKEANEETYACHANEQKNDFSNWTKDIIGDVKLAKDLQKATNLKGALTIVKQRIGWLRKRTK